MSPSSSYYRSKRTRPHSPTPSLSLIYGKLIGDWSTDQRGVRKTQVYSKVLGPSPEKTTDRYWGETVRDPVRAQCMSGQPVSRSRRTSTVTLSPALVPLVAVLTLSDVGPTPTPTGRLPDLSPAPFLFRGGRKGGSGRTEFGTGDVGPECYPTE